MEIGEEWEAEEGFEEDPRDIDIIEVVVVRVPEIEDIEGEEEGIVILLVLVSRLLGEDIIDTDTHILLLPLCLVRILIILTILETIPRIHDRKYIHPLSYWPVK